MQFEWFKVKETINKIFKMNKIFKSVALNDPNSSKHYSVMTWQGKRIRQFKDKLVLH